MKIVFVIPFFKRLDLTDMCFSELKKQGCDIYAVGSEGEKSKYIADKNGVTYLEFDNNPVSAKHNALMGMLKDVDFDYACLIGSDDFVSPNFVAKMTEFLESKKPDYTENTGVYFYHQKHKVTTYYNGFNGAGRFYSKRLLEALNYTLWEDNLNYGLDGSSKRVIIKAGFKPTYVDIQELGIELVDVKYADSITPHGAIYRGKESKLNQINVTMFDVLENYNTRTRRTQPPRKYYQSNKVRLIEKATGIIKMLPIHIANKLLNKGTHTK